MANLKDFINALKQSNDNPGLMNQYVGTARNETPGSTLDQFKGMPKDELSQYDRFSHAMNAQRMSSPIERFSNVVGIPMIAGANEISKAIPGMQGSIANITGDDSFKPDPNTSSPSFRNFLAAAQGGLYGAFK